MATDSFNIYLSPVGAKSLDRFVINWQAGAKLIRHVRQYNGFVTLNASAIKNVMTCLKGTRGYPAVTIPIVTAFLTVTDIFQIIYKNKYLR